MPTVTTLDNHGIQIISLSDPADPTVVGSIEHPEIVEAHNLAIFESRGAIYAAVTIPEPDSFYTIDILPGTSIRI